MRAIVETVFDEIKRIFRRTYYGLRRFFLLCGKQ